MVAEMGRPRWRRGIGLLLVGLIGQVGLGAPPPAQHPNIVVILADDLGYGELGCYGGKRAPTPHIDQLARTGTRYTQFYAGAPICSPSRTALLTGQYPGRWRITSFLQDRAGNRACGQADFLDPKAPTSSRAFKASDYATGHFGKWHLGGGRDVHDAPHFAAYGVDEHAGTYESPEPDPDITSTRWIFAPGDKVKRWERSAFFVDRTLDFLKRNQARHQPSFVNLWLDDPHTPWIPGPNAPAGETAENLRGVLIDMDHQVGRLVDGINQLGLGPDTIILFLSDNGPLPPLNNSRTAGLRGTKLSLYEGGIREPLIAAWPGHIPAGRVDEHSVIMNIDLLPTLLTLAQVKPPGGVTFDGLDRAPAFVPGQPLDRPEPLFWEYGRNETAYKYPGIARNRSPNVAVRVGPWKCLVNADGSKAELYDLAADPNETTDVAAEHPDRLRSLVDAAVRWRRSLP